MQIFQGVWGRLAHWILVCGFLYIMETNKLRNETLTCYYLVSKMDPLTPYCIAWLALKMSSPFWVAVAIFLER